MNKLSGKITLILLLLVLSWLTNYPTADNAALQWRMCTTTYLKYLHKGLDILSEELQEVITRYRGYQIFRLIGTLVFKDTKVFTIAHLKIFM